MIKDLFIRRTLVEIQHKKFETIFSRFYIHKSRIDELLSDIDSDFNVTFYARFLTERNIKKILDKKNIEYGRVDILNIKELNNYVQDYSIFFK